MKTFFIRNGRRYREATRGEVCEQAADYHLQQMNSDRVDLSSPTRASEYLKARGAVEHEQFGVVYLDNRHRVIHSEVLFEGTIDGASVYPREIVKRVLQHNAAAVILFHNHPSGIAEPSSADERITTRIKAALDLIDVRLLDHLIVAGLTIASFAQKGLL